MGDNAVAGGLHVPLETQIKNAERIKDELARRGSGLDWENCRKVHKALIVMGMGNEGGQGLLQPFIPSKSFQPSPSYQYIKTIKELSYLAASVLCEQKVIAVDIKNSDESFEGFTCFLQLAFYNEKKMKM